MLHNIMKAFLRILFFFPAMMYSSQRRVHFDSLMIDNISTIQKIVPVKYGSSDGSGIDSLKAKGLHKKSKAEIAQVAFEFFLSKFSQNFSKQFKSRIIESCRFEERRRKLLLNYEDEARKDLYSSFYDS